MGGERERMGEGREDGGGREVYRWREKGRERVEEVGYMEGFKH
jgi:hypothetical protein